MLEWDCRAGRNALKDGRPAVAHFYSRFAPQVHRLLFRILGHDSELEDAVHDMFVRALDSIHGLRDPKALRSWIIGIALYVARIRIQRGGGDGCTWQPLPTCRSQQVSVIARATSASETMTVAADSAKLRRLSQVRRTGHDGQILPQRRGNFDNVERRRV